MVDKNDPTGEKIYDIEKREHKDRDWALIRAGHLLFLYVWLFLW